MYEDIKNKPEIKTDIIGEKKLKGVENPITVYKILTEQETKEDNQSNSSIVNKSEKNTFKYFLSARD